MVLKISKLFLVTLSHFIVASTHPVDETSVLLQQALQKIPNPHNDFMIREVGKKIAQKLQNDFPSFKVVLPNADHIHSVNLLSWAFATGMESSLQEPIGNVRKLVSQPINSHPDVYSTCREGLEVLTVMFMMQHDALARYNNKQLTDFHDFVIDLLLNCPEK